MTGPMPITPDDAEFQKWKASRTPVTHDDAEFQAWKAKQGGGIQDISAQLQQQVDARQAQANKPAGPLATAVDYAAMLNPGLIGRGPNMANVAKRGVAMAAGAVPGSTALGAYVTSKTTGKPYADVMRDVNAQMSDMPSSERTALEMVGGIPTAGAVGKAVGKIPFLQGIANPVVRGAATGAATGAPLAAAYRAAQPNPESLASRASGTAKAGATGGVIGGIGGAVAPMVAARRLAANAPSADVAASDAAEAAKTADQQNFGKARTEAAAAGGTSPAIQRALANPDIEPYVNDVRASPAMRGASDADVLMKAHALMSERQGQLIGPMDARRPGVGSSLENIELGMGKSALKQAASASDLQYHPPVTETVPGVPARTKMRSPSPVDIRDATGKLRRTLTSVPDDALEQEWRRLAELNNTEEAMHAGVREAGYRFDYEELPRTEKMGHAGMEDLPDADGNIDPERLAADNKIIRDYNKSQVVRAARSKAMDRIEAEVAARQAGTARQAKMQRVEVSPAIPARENEVSPARWEASPAAMPSFPSAVEEHAQNARNADAADVVRKIARRELTGAKTPLNQSKLQAQGDFNTGRMAAAFDPGQRAAGQQEILSQLKETPRFARFLKVPVAPSRASLIAPSLLQKMGDTRPSTMGDLLRTLLLSGAAPQFGNAP